MGARSCWAGRQLVLKRLWVRGGAAECPGDWGPQFIQDQHCPVQWHHDCILAEGFLPWSLKHTWHFHGKRDFCFNWCIGPVFGLKAEKWHALHYRAGRGEEKRQWCLSAGLVVVRRSAGAAWGCWRWGYGGMRDGSWCCEGSVPPLVPCQPQHRSLNMECGPTADWGQMDSAALP